MSVIIIFFRNWVRWYRVLRYCRKFSFTDSIRHALWLARG
jgi:hypothetical protein